MRSQIISPREVSIALSPRAGSIYARTSSSRRSISTPLTASFRVLGPHRSPCGRFARRGTTVRTQRGPHLPHRYEIGAVTARSAFIIASRLSPSRARARNGVLIITRCINPREPVGTHLRGGARVPLRGRARISAEDRLSRKISLFLSLFLSVRHERRHHFYPRDAESRMKV